MQVWIIKGNILENQNPRYICMSLTAMFLGLNSSLVSKCFMCHPNESLLSAIYYIYLKLSCINSFIKHVLFIKHRHYFKVARNVSSRYWKWVEDKRVTQNWDVRLKVSRGNDKYTWVFMWRGRERRCSAAVTSFRTSFTMLGTSGMAVWSILLPAEQCWFTAQSKRIVFLYSFWNALLQM